MKIFVSISKSVPSSNVRCLIDCRLISSGDTAYKQQKRRVGKNVTLVFHV
jgi:hypothetical protein